MVHGGQHPQRNGDHNRHENRERRQQQRRREFGGKGPEHILARDIACTHIPSQHSAEPGDILGEEWLIQPQLRTLCVDDLL